MDYPLHLPDQLALHLKSLRKAAAMSQAELARQLGVTQSRVAAIEKDPGAVSVRQLMDILQLLDADLLMRTREAGAEPARAAEAEAGGGYGLGQAAGPLSDAGDLPPAGKPRQDKPDKPSRPEGRAPAFRPQALPPDWLGRRPKGSW